MKHGADDEEGGERDHKVGAARIDEAVHVGIEEESVGGVDGPVDADGGEAGGPGTQPLESKGADARALQKHGEDRGDEEEVEDLLRVPVGDARDVEVWVVRAVVLPEAEQKNEESHHAEPPAPGDPYEQEGEQDVEVFLNGKRPEVAGEEPVGDGVVGISVPKIVAVEKDCAEEVAPVLVNPAQQGQQRDGREIDEGGGLNSKDAAGVEALEIDAADDGLFFEEAGTDQDAADREKEMDPVAAETMEEGCAEGADVPDEIVREQNADGEGAPAVKTGEIAALVAIGAGGEGGCHVRFQSNGGRVWGSSRRQGPNQRGYHLV